MFTTGTIHGTYLKADGTTPAEGTIHVIPNVKQILDATGNKILAGRLRIALDNTGSFSATVPASDDATLNPSGVTYTVSAQLRYVNLPAVVGISVPTGATVDMADVSSVDPEAPAYAAQVTPAQLAALDGRVDALEAGGSGVTSVAGRTGVVTLTKADVGLSAVDNTSDVGKPVSTAATTALAAKADTSALTSAIASEVSRANAAYDASGAAAAAQSAATTAAATDATGKVATETSRATTAEALLAPKASPTFTGTVSGVTKSMVGLANVDNTADSAKPVSTAQATADTAIGTAAATDATTKANAAQAAAVQRANHTGTQSADTLTDGTTNKAFLATERTKLTGVATGATANSSDATLLARANHTGTQTASTISDFSTAADARVTAAVGATVEAHDTDLTTIAGLTPTNDDVIQRKAGAWTNRTMAQVKTDLALAKADVGLGSVDNTADTAKPVSTAQQTALDLKANLASPTFTGTVAGISKSMVGLGSADNTTDASKPVSTAQAAADTAVQAAAVQRANHTGTQLAATISDLTGSWTSLTLTSPAGTTATYFTPGVRIETNDVVRLRGRITTSGSSYVAGNAFITLPFSVTTNQAVVARSSTGLISLLISGNTIKPHTGVASGATIDLDGITFLNA